MAEAYRKRNYPNHFKSKLSDSDAENTETQSWLHFARACKYVEEREFLYMIKQSEEVGKLLNYMINNPGKYGAAIK